MTPKHEYFELLCALAHIGQVSPSELSEFRQHSRFCVDCRQRLLELTQLHATMVVTNVFERPATSAPRGMTKRFVERAVREGIPLAERNPAVEHVDVILAGATLAVLLVAGTLLGRSRIAQHPAPPELVSLPHSTQFSAAIESTTSPGSDLAESKLSRRVEFRQVRISRQHRRQQLTALSITRPVNQLASAEKTNSQGSITTPTGDMSDHTSLREDVLSLFNSTSKFPKFRYSLSRQNPGKEPDLLTASVCSPPGPFHLRGNFALASSAPFFSSDIDAHKPALKPDFEPDPATFQLIENVRQ